MKKIGIILLLFLGMLSACNDFLNVTADNEMVEEELFNDYKGVRMAVNGVYRTVSSTKLYGKNLTWGFASAIGHNYQALSLQHLPKELYYSAQFAWENSDVRSVTGDIWNTAYNAISSCNNIIQHVSEKDTTFFEIGATEKNMILGEMYGLRAMLHFDLYRLFAPAPVTGYSGLTIPYVIRYPDHQPEHKNAKDVMNLIIEDMERAKALLARVDTVFCKNWNRSMMDRLPQVDRVTDSSPNDFMGYRGTRMNFWAVTGLLARIYLYNGDGEKAYESARVNYQSHLENRFKWTSFNNQGALSSIEDIHPKRPEEILLSFSNRKNYDNWDALTGENNSFFQIKNVDPLFEGDEDDYRKLGWYNRYNNNRYLTWIRPGGTSSKAKDIVANQGPLLPIISLPEMYHILIECLINQNKTKEAVALLNTLRVNRGAKAPISEIDDLKKKLMEDIVRETLTSGQTFFLFKRLNRNIYNGETDIVMAPAAWTIPLPQSETDYQLN